MAGHTNITSRFTNADKREAELLAVTIPAILQQGGGRSQAQPVFLQGSEALTASVIEADTILTKMYVIVDEVFPAGAVLNIDIAGINFTATPVPLTAGGMTVSVVEDSYFASSQSVTATVTGVTGDITTGKARIVMATEHPSITNGRYAS